MGDGVAEWPKVGDLELGCIVVELVFEFAHALILSGQLRLIQNYGRCAECVPSLSWRAVR